MNVLPKALLRLVDAFGYLPGVGPRTAERYAYFALKNDSSKLEELAGALTRLKGEVSYCQVTFMLIDNHQKISQLYSDPKRDKQTVAVVADSFDVVALEKTGVYKGTYHVLGGLISPLEGVGPENLTIKQLVKRVSKDNVKELIIATNASIEGETTALFIQRQLVGQRIKISRLARGLPIGLDLEYADQITLSRALEGRQNFDA